jgi:predicted DNA-binding transcriptional regulator AlpA
MSRGPEQEPETSVMKAAKKPLEIEKTRAINVAEFCRMYGIAPRTFYNNREHMPETFKLGRRVLIFTSVIEIWEQNAIKMTERRDRTGCMT